MADDPKKGPTSPPTTNPPAPSAPKPAAAVGAPGSSSQDINVNPAPGEKVQSPVASPPAVGAPAATPDVIEAQPGAFAESPAQTQQRLGAPAVHTDSRTTFYKQKIAELERQAIQAENLQGAQRVAARAQIRAQIQELRERESRRFSGADPRTPRGSILHAEEAITQRPDMHYRFININSAGKADNAKALGYEKVPESEGGKTLGDLALFRIPMDRRMARVNMQNKESRDRIKRVVDDLKGEVREMAKFLRGRGVDIDENRLGIFSDGSEED